MYHVSRGYLFLGLTRKIMEKTNEDADDALLYFQSPPPVGVHGVNRHILVDVDETGIWLAVCR